MKRAPMIRLPSGCELTGVELLRLIVRNLDANRESVNALFTADQLIKLGLAQLHSDWDYPIENWTERQIREALQKRKPPQWSLDGQPLHD